VSGQEIAAIVYKEQGFLVMIAYELCETGSIHLADTREELGTETALRCVAPSNYQEFAQQQKRMSELLKEDLPFFHGLGARYYRMEPVD
jgi:hypothetical protein